MCDVHTRHVEYLLPDFVNGKLEAELRSGVEIHLEECVGCRAELETLRHAFQLIAAPGTPGPSSAYFAGVLPRVRERLERSDSLATIAGPIMTRFALPLAAGVLAVLLLLHTPYPKHNSESARNPLRPVLSGFESEDLLEIALDQFDRQSFPGTLGEGETSALLAAPILKGEYLLSNVEFTPTVQDPVLGDEYAEDLESLSDVDLEILVVRLSERTSL
jgi:hypothetical protein